ncbi:MAG: HEAT repeat domain-containing protein, partial [Methylococcales bacterium]
DIPEKIWILASSGLAMPSGSEAKGSDGPCGALQSASPGAPGQEQASKDPGKPVLLSQRQSDALLKQVRSRDLAARAEAITRLASVENDGEVLDLLREALADQHPAIRAQAVSTLAARKAPGSDQILRQALLDPDADVRLMAVDHAGDDESLLRMALDDANNNVRLLADMKLEQLYNQHQDNGAGP